MKLTVTFLLATSATCLTAWQLDPNCGIKGPSNFERIMGGDAAAPHEFPWFASDRTCGASVISKDWLLTAGHCLSTVDNDTKVHFYFGTNNWIDDDALTRVSKKIVVHPKFVGPFPTVPDFDIALVKLSESLPLDDPSVHIGSICLPEPDPTMDAFAGKNSIICGFGDTENNTIDRSFTLILRKVNLTVWDQHDCIHAYNTTPPITPVPVNDNMICASAYDKGTCQGDSGGPLVTLNEKTGRWQQIGIVSWSHSCAINYHPSVFTRVATFLPWIQETIQKYSD